MDQTVVPGGRLAWQEATVVAIRPLTPRVKSFLLNGAGLARLPRRPACRRAPDGA